MSLKDNSITNHEEILDYLKDDNDEVTPEEVKTVLEIIRDIER